MLTGGFRRCGCSQHGIPAAASSSRGLEQRQPHDPRVAAAQVLDEHRAAPLDGVAARLVARLAAVPVGAALGALRARKRTSLALRRMRERRRRRRAPPR